MAEPVIAAAVLRELGGVPTAGRFPAPRAGAGQRLVEVDLAGLNPVDLTLAAGRFPTGPPPLPSVVGREGVGRDEDGRRVYFGPCVPPYGSIAERTVAPAEALYPLPDGIDDGLAVALGVSGLAAWMPLTRRGRLQPGETVLVLGATGVAGTIAVQAARALGAGRVVAAGRNPEALERLRALGADATVRLNAGGDLVAALREAAGGSIDLTIDLLWGPPAVAALHAAGADARHVQVGNAASPEATLPASGWRLRQVSILGYSNAPVSHRERARGYAELVEQALAGRITVGIEEFSLESIAEVWERQDRAAGRKLTIRLR